jgi:hypothetical protein
MVQGVMRLIDEIDWGSLQHAYGFAHDTPAHLKALASADAVAREAATDHLFTAVIHQGFPESANAPTARVVAMMLAEDAAAPEAREALVELLGLMAFSTSNAEHMEYAATLLSSLEEAMQESYPVVRRFLDAPDLSMRRTAVGAVISHVWTRRLAHHQPALTARLMEWARTRGEERVYWVGELARLGENTEEFLADESVHVQVAAALSPALEKNTAATGIIVEALSRAAEDGAPGPLTLSPHELYSLSHLIKAAIARVEDLQRIAMPAAAIARRGSQVGFDTTWGPLMRAIFRPPHSDGAGLTPLQRDFLAALVENPKIWAYTCGNTERLFKDVGLPFNREACARVADGG